MNAGEFAILLETRCNYFTTLEGVVLSHRIKNQLAEVAYIGRVLKYSWLASEIVFNFIDDVLVLSLALLSI